MQLNLFYFYLKFLYILSINIAVLDSRRSKTRLPTLLDPFIFNRSIKFLMENERILIENERILIKNEKTLIENARILIEMKAF